MLVGMKKWFRLEFFNDEEDRQVARILLFTMIAATIICLVTLVSGIFWRSPAITLVGALGLLVQAVAMTLFAFKRLTASGFLIGASSIILITLVAMQGYGVHDIIIMAYPVITFVCVLVLKRVWSVTISTLAMLAVAWLVFGEVYSLFTVPSHFPNGLKDLLGVFGILGVSFLLTNMQAGNLRRTLINARKEIVQRRDVEKKLRFMGTHDILTGAYNRLFLDEELIRLEQSRDYPVSIILSDISIILSDIDGLKETNDRLGHEAGDELIRRANQVLRSSIREGDILARIGGDEFAVLLPDTGEETAWDISNRIRNKKNEFNASHRDMPVRLSLGTATARRGSLQTIFNEADKRMYEEKAVRKRNQDTVPLPRK
jgi:diguanylate cyclase (GGDEF)-like protein